MEQEFVDLTVKYIEELIRHDEVERALLVLDNVPAYFRDTQPLEFKELKREIMSAICTPSIYLEDSRDSNVDVDQALIQINQLLRGILIKREVEGLNKIGLTPRIVDMGPGDYFVPLALKKLTFKFSYKALSMNAMAGNKAYDLLGDVLESHPTEDPKIFIANEVIEHLPNPYDIATNCFAFAGSPHYIHLSTPTYTFDSAKKDWRVKGGLPHLRAYTPVEFYQEVLKMFPGYAWQMYQGPVMSLRGIREDIEDKSALLTASDYETKAQAE